MNPHYEHIRLACIKANPKILDLVMGCHIETRFFGTKVLPMDAVKGEKSFIKLEDGRVLDVIEILGRPITLQDVIVALYIGEENFEKASYIAGTDGEKLYFKSHFTGEIFIYNLSKPFSEQSDEFYQWCAEQLGYNS